MLKSIRHSLLESPAELQEYQQIRDDIIGPAELVTLESGTEDGGGIAFERNSWITPVKEDGRCYTIGQSHQHSRGLVSPNAAGKIMDSEMNKDQELRQRMVKVCPIYCSLY
jgi:hypothetical protein